MYLQLSELCLSVPHFRPCLMLILQLNGLLVYIFKVDVIFFFKALPGLSSSDRNVHISFPHPHQKLILAHRGLLLPPGWEHSGLDLSTATLGDTFYVSIGAVWDRKLGVFHSFLQTQPLPWCQGDICIFLAPIRSPLGTGGEKLS